MAIWLAAWIVLPLICWVIDYRLSGSWLWTAGLIALYLGGSIWQEKMDQLKNRVLKLEQRIDRLEKRASLDS